MEEEMKEQNKKYAKLIAKVWSDASFKERLLADPRAVLEAEGISVPPGVDVKVLEQTYTQLFLVIPTPPLDVNIQDIDQRMAASSPSVIGCMNCH
jgi:hypothetical protein